MWRLRWGFIPHQSLTAARHPLRQHITLPSSALYHQLPPELQLHIVQYLNHTLIVKQYREVHVVRWTRKAYDAGPRVTIYVSIYHSHASYSHFNNIVAITHYTTHVFQHTARLHVHHQRLLDTADLYGLHLGNYNRYSHLPLPPSDRHRKRSYSQIYEAQALGLRAARLGDVS
jgi:hypothetical protein